MAVFTLWPTATYWPRVGANDRDGYACLKRLLRLLLGTSCGLALKLGGPDPGFCIGSGASRSAGLAALIQVLDLLQYTNGP